MSLSPYNHPCARPIDLGELVSHETFNAAPSGERPDWRTQFNYERGSVELSATNNGQTYHYATIIHGQAGVTYN